MPRNQKKLRVQASSYNREAERNRRRARLAARKQHRAMRPNIEAEATRAER